MPVVSKLVSLHHGSKSAIQHSTVRQSVGGPKVVTGSSNELYPPTSVEYSVSTATNPSVLPDEHTDCRSEGEMWAVVSVDVTEWGPEYGGCLIPEQAYNTVPSTPVIPRQSTRHARDALTRDG
jgi:hypothetical protein